MRGIPVARFEAVLGTLEIRRFDFVADAVSSCRYGSQARRAGSNKGSRTVSPAKEEKSLMRRSASDSEDKAQDDRAWSIRL